MTEPTFNSRYYVYLFSPDGSSRFLTTFLNHDQAVKYCKSYYSIFPERVEKFEIKTLTTKAIEFIPVKE